MYYKPELFQRDLVHSDPLVTVPNELLLRVPMLIKLFIKLVVPVYQENY